MTIEEARQKIEELRMRFSQPYSSFDKQTITTLYSEVCGRKIRHTSCQSCYHDAVIEIYLHLKRNYMANQCKYRLRAGFIINTPMIDGVYSNANLTDEVAAKYLELFPQKANMFETIPPKGEEKPKDVPKTDADGTKDVEVANTTLDKKKPVRTRKTKK